MEVYEGIADFETFVAALHVAVAAAQCDDFTQGKRHLECFSAPNTTP